MSRNYPLVGRFIDVTRSHRWGDCRLCPPDMQRPTELNIEITQGTQVVDSFYLCHIHTSQLAIFLHKNIQSLDYVESEPPE